MAAPRGNQFWKIRAKHGPNVLFATADKLWTAACEYFEWSDKTPLIAIEYNGKDAKRCEVPKMRPYTIGGLCLYLGVHIKYLNEAKARLAKSKKATDKDLADTITRIEQIIYTQKFEGAASGFLNPTLMSRDLGLVEKTATEAKIETNLKAQLSGKVEVTVRNSGVPLATKEGDVDAKR